MTTAKKRQRPDGGTVDNHEIAATIPNGETRLLGLEGGTRTPSNLRIIWLSDAPAQALDDVLLYRMPVCARIADRLKRMVLQRHPDDTLLLALVDVLNESVELGAVRSRTLYCTLTKAALKGHWEGQGPARGIRP